MEELLNQFKEMNQNHLESAENYQSTNNQLNSDLLDAKNKVATLNNTVCTLNSEIEEEKNLRSITEAEFESLFNEMDKKINTFDKGADLMKSEQVKLNQMCELLSNDKGELSAKNTELNHKVNQLTTSNNTSSENVKELTRKVEQITNEKEGLQTKVTEQTKCIANLYGSENECKKITESSNILKNDLSKINEEYQKLKKESEDIQKLKRENEKSSVTKKKRNQKPKLWIG